VQLLSRLLAQVSQVCAVLLQRSDIRLTRDKCVDALHRCTEALHGGYAGNSFGHSSRPNLIAVDAGSDSVGSVHDQVDISGHDRIHGGGSAIFSPTFVLFAENVDGHTVAAQYLCGALGGEDREPQVGEALDG